MIDFAIAWLLAHPLGGVCGITIVSVAVGVFLVPRLHDAAGHAPRHW